jgi:alpha/beta superfamily hydrolase
MRKVLFCLFGLALLSCNKDVDGLLLRGTPTEYDFSNATLEGYLVDESKVERFTVESDYKGSKETIEVAYVGDKSTISSDTIFVYMHGNLGHLNLYWQDVAKIANYGLQHRFGVLMMDYRGFGNSTGLSENIGTMQADIDACLSWLIDQGAKADNIVLYGYSLGALVGAHVAAYSEVVDIKSFINVAPQTSADVLMQDATGLSLPSTYVTDFGYDVPKALEAFSNNMLWIHGTADETASYENFLLFYDNYDNPNKQSFIEKGASHGIADDIGFTRMEKLILEFIQ